jgi:hypothetical protein
MFSSLGISNNVGFFNHLCEVLQPYLKGTYSTFRPKSPMTKTVPTDGLSLAGLGDPRALGTVNNLWSAKFTYTNARISDLALLIPALGVASSSSSRGLHPLIGACRLHCSPTPPCLHTQTRHTMTGTAQARSRDNGTQLLSK